MEHSVFARLQLILVKMIMLLQQARQLCVQMMNPENLTLPAPLSTVGEHEVPLRLPKSIPLPGGNIQRAVRVKIRFK